MRGTVDEKERDKQKHNARIKGEEMLVQKTNFGC
jgi:hypothetical protein